MFPPPQSLAALDSHPPCIGPTCRFLRHYQNRIHCYPTSSVDHTPPHPQHGTDTVPCSHLTPIWTSQKFLAGLIPQMRAGKSYLAAHPSWFKMDTHSLSPRCHTAPDTFQHAILHCEALRPERDHFLPRFSSVAAASPIWSSDENISALISNMNRTATGFPPDMFPPFPALNSASPLLYCYPSPWSTFSSVDVRL